MGNEGCESLASVHYQTPKNHQQPSIGLFEGTRTLTNNPVVAHLAEWKGLVERGQRKNKGVPEEERAGSTCLLAPEHGASTMNELRARIEPIILLVSYSRTQKPAIPARRHVQSLLPTETDHLSQTSNVVHHACHAPCIMQQVQMPRVSSNSRLRMFAWTREKNKGQEGIMTEIDKPTSEHQHQQQQQLTSTIAYPSNPIQ